jgi:Holliday junction resolvase-like predicted endonuclease
LTCPLETKIILTILEQEAACQLQELNNRAKCFRIPPAIVDSVYSELKTQRRVDITKVETPSLEKKETRFIYSTGYTATKIEEVISQKAELLAKHYDLHYEIGKHGENLVGQVCEELGYTEIEIRKEKHLDQDLLEAGIQRRDIDVFAKHPTRNYYQFIEVKNRRERVHQGDIDEKIRTRDLARSRWQLDIEIAFVAVRSTQKAQQRLRAEDIPLAFAGKIHVPEVYRKLYEELNERLAYDFLITDVPSPYLRQNVATYVLPYPYKKKPD